MAAKKWSNNQYCNPIPPERGPKNPPNILVSSLDTVPHGSVVSVQMCTYMKVLKYTDGFYAYFISEWPPLGFGKFLTCSPKTFPFFRTGTITWNRKSLKMLLSFWHSYKDSAHIRISGEISTTSSWIEAACACFRPQQTGIRQLTLLKNILVCWRQKTGAFKNMISAQNKRTVGFFNPSIEILVFTFNRDKPN